MTQLSGRRKTSTMNQAAIRDAMFGWLEARVGRDDLAWLQDGQASLRAGLAGSEAQASRALYILLGRIPRRLGKAKLDLSERELDAARKLRPGWDPDDLSTDEAARLWVMLWLTDAGFARRLEGLCRTAEVAEAVALYRGLPIYPHQAELEPVAAEGLRSNMRVVFEAVAHRSPFPQERFDEARWNQMVLKALFIGSALHPIQGLDERGNPELAAMLIDYAHERWAARRKVPAELWRCVGPFAHIALPDFERALTSADPAERGAAALSIAQCKHPSAQALWAQHPQLRDMLERKQLSWASLTADMDGTT